MIDESSNLNLPEEPGSPDVAAGAESAAAASPDPATATEPQADSTVVDSAPEEAETQPDAGAEAAESDVAESPLGDTDASDELAADDDEDDFDDDPNAKPLEDLSEAEEDDVVMQWYILKVQSNRENSICDALHRRVAVEGLERYFGEILVPTEDVAEFKNGKRRVIKRKLYPGYIVVHMMLTDETWFAVRETPGIGDFTGSAGKPSPMLPHEIEQIVKSSKPDEDSDEPIKTAIPYKIGDRVRIKEGTFENFEGDVEGIDEANGRITVVINIFNRSTPVELEHWQIENV